MAIISDIYVYWFCMITGPLLFSEAQKLRCTVLAFLPTRHEQTDR